MYVIKSFLACTLTATICTDAVFADPLLDRHLALYFLSLCTCSYCALSPAFVDPLFDFHPTTAFSCCVRAASVM